MLWLPELRFYSPVGILRETRLMERNDKALEIGGT
jgi:hypothetical protein